MCVAILVESKRGPTATELAHMEAHNPHGGGVGFPSGTDIEYRRGLTAKQIAKMLPQLPRPTLVHFRWATHGPRVPELCHPFPLGVAAFVRRTLRGRAPGVLIHNGVWNDAHRHCPRWQPYERTSDTAVAAFMVGTGREDILDEVPWSTAIMRSSGPGKADVVLRGYWTEYNGDLYSNLNWQPNRWSKANGSQVPLWDEYRAANDACESAE